MSQLSPFWLSGLALTPLVTDVNSRRILIKRNRFGRDSDLWKKRIIIGFFVAFSGTTIISILAILVGTVAYRAGLIFKKPS